MTRRARNAGIAALLAAVLFGGWLSLHMAPAAWLAQAAAGVNPSSRGARAASVNKSTHGTRAIPDYTRLFSMDKVHDIHITIAPDRFRMMQADLKSIGADSPMAGLGAPPGGARGGAPPGGRGMGGMANMQEMMELAVKECVGKPAAAACSAGPMGGGTCTDMFNAGQLMCVPEVFAKLGRGGAMNLTTRDPVDIPVTVTHDGEFWTQVGMRYKGNSSLVSTAASGNGKVPFRLDFAHYESGDQTFYGFRKLTFSSNFGDDSQLHDTLANEILRDRGVPAPRTAFYRVFVDTGAGAQYWGLYTMIEDPADGAMLAAQFGGADGNLYKPDGVGADWTEFSTEGFGKKTTRKNKKIDDYGDVQAAIRALHAPRDNPHAWRTALEAAFNVDGFLRYLAVNTAIEDWDQYGAMAHNYYLYGDPARRGQLQWISWDHNFAFGAGPMGGRGMPGGGAPGRGIGPAGIPGGGLPGRGGPGRGGLPFGVGIDILAEKVGDRWPLITLLMADDVYARRYRELLVHAMGGLYEPSAFDTRARELHALIASSVVGPGGERPTHTTITSAKAFEDSLEGPDGLLQHIRGRQAAVRAALASASSR